MNQNIQKLYEIAQKQTRKIIGLMSGTSLDGLDVALCEFSGSGLQTKVEVLNFETIPFEETQKQAIREIFAKKIIDFQLLTVINPWIGNLHGKMVNICLKKWGLSSEDIDCIASHGQTVFHAPSRLHGLSQYPNATLQIGDGDHLAVETGIITISDFRQKHCAAGGEGAPLAVYGDYLMFSKKGTDRILLNMGGISNYTFLAADLDASKVYATDTGPGNTLMDSLMRKSFDLPFDMNGQVASKGQINESLLNSLKSHPFFGEGFPKTTGPELFNLEYLQKALIQSGNDDLKVEDQMATLNRFTAETIAEALHDLIKGKSNVEVIMSGGGVHNKLVVGHLKSLLPGVTFFKTDELGIKGDAKEAVLFAILANEALAGGNTNFGDRKKVPSVSMGKVSFPG